MNKELEGEILELKNFEIGNRKFSCTIYCLDTNEVLGICKGSFDDNIGNIDKYLIYLSIDGGYSNITEKIYMEKYLYNPISEYIRDYINNNVYNSIIIKCLSTSENHQSSKIIEKCKAEN